MTGAGRAAGTRWGGFFRWRAGWGRLFLLIIGCVKAGALEDHPASATDEAHQLLLAAFGAFLELGLGHTL